MDVSSVIEVVRNLCLTGGGLCGVAALIMYAVTHWGSSRSSGDGASEGAMMGLILAAIAFFAAGVLVATVDVSWAG